MTSTEKGKYELWEVLPDGTRTMVHAYDTLSLAIDVALQSKKEHPVAGVKFSVELHLPLVEV